ncbi:MAG: hypothetical protein ABIH48_02365 [Candidatus Falkowbacteria bacterium]
MPKKDKIHLGTITILVKDRHSNAKSVNQVLTEHGHIIVARLGVNVNRTCLKNCTGLITITVEGTAKQINALKRELDKLYGIVAKKIIITSE